MRISGLIIATILVSGTLHAQNIGINSTGAVPNASAMLDVVSTNSGILIPRVALTATNAAGPVTSPANSLLVYNTATAGTAPNNVTPGYYYWETASSRWLPVLSGVKGWTTTGNAGTAIATNFLGTTDNVGFRIRTNNAERFEFTNNGRLRAFDNGTVDQPTYSWTGTGNTNTGIWRPTTSTISFTTNGTDRFRIPNTNQVHAMANGTATAPFYSWSANAGTGLFQQAANVLGFSTNGTERFRIPNANQVHATQNGTAALPFYSWSTNTGIGLFRATTNVLGLSTASVERMRLRADGNITINTTNSNFISPDGHALTVISNYLTGNTSDDVGFHAIAGISAYGIGVWGQSVLGDGVWGLSQEMEGTGVYGRATATGSTALAQGVWGTTNAAGSLGIYGTNNHASGTGGMLVGNNVTGNYLTTGSGGAFTGNTAGGYAKATNSTSGVGLIALGNNGVTAYSPIRGSGIAGTGTRYGVVGYATTTVNSNPSNNEAGNGVNASAGGYFEVQSGGTAQTWAYVGVQDNTSVLRKIIGPGTVNTIVRDLDDNLVALSAPEAPENLFQDYGQGQLENGKARIELDPILAKNIVVNDKHPLRVFIQLEGDCNGVFVTNKTGNGFDVVELQDGSSNTPFMWSVVANRADEVLPDGSISRYSAERFPLAPGPVKKVALETRDAVIATKKLDSNIEAVPSKLDGVKKTKLTIKEHGDE